MEPIYKYNKNQAAKILSRLLKTVGGDRFLMKFSFFTFLVCPLNKEPIELSDFHPLYLKM